MSKKVCPGAMSRPHAIVALDDRNAILDVLWIGPRASLWRRLLYGWWPRCSYRLVSLREVMAEEER